jgi:hypothetical protein
VRRWITASFVAAVLLACTSSVRASVVPDLTTNITMDCSTSPGACSFDPGSQGSPELGMADFSSVAPGWSASFDSAPAISWGVILDEYIADFGMGGSFTIDAPGGMQLTGMLTSGVAFLFPGGNAEAVAAFQGYWNNGMFADGVMIGDSIGNQGLDATLMVTTHTPEPGSFLLFGSAMAGLAGMFRRTLH